MGSDDRNITTLCRKHLGKLETLRSFLVKGERSLLEEEYEEITKLKEKLEECLRKNGLTKEAEEFSMLRLPPSDQPPDMVRSIDDYISFIRRLQYRIEKPPNTTSPGDSSDEIIEELKGYLDELDNTMSYLQSHPHKSSYAFEVETKIDIWKNSVKKFFERNSLLEEAQKFSKISKSESRIPTVADMITRADMYSYFIRTTIKNLSPMTVGLKNESFKVNQPDIDITSNEKPIRQTSKRNKVFVVHGHDKANLYELRDLLEKRYELECTIMMWKPGKGRTLIEKFEQEAQEAGFAFILMTPDDLVKVEGKEEYAQARPNVIFELGWFYGQLGRDRVCIILREGTEIHSDLKGISQIIFNKSVEEKVPEIEAELRAAGLIE